MSSWLKLNRHNRWLGPILVTLVTLFVVSTYMYYYLCGELRGNLDWFILSSARFGQPKIMQQHDQTPLYVTPAIIGWDGQFYFYMTNDLLGNTDAVQHIDQPVYRYQRIGLPLTAAIVAKVTGQSWVSPKTYYFTYLALILFSTLMLARFFQARGYSPWWTLCWSLSFGVQFMLMTGLPDAAAEAYLALALIAYVDRRYWLYALCATLCALTREAFILIFATLFTGHLIYDWRARAILEHWKKYLAFALPGLIFLCWQIYIRIHFHASPIAVANGANIIGWPLQSFFQNVIVNIKQLVFTGDIYTFIKTDAVMQLVSLTFFFMLILTISIYLIYWLKTRKIEPSVKILLIGCLLLVFMNLFLGNLVMFYYTGSLKAINFIALLLPFLACVNNVKLKPMIKALLISYLLAGLYLSYPRIFLIPIGSSITSPFTYTTENFPVTASCQNGARAPLTINNITQVNFYKNTFFDKRNNYYVVNITINNQNNYALVRTQGQGSYNISYQVVNQGKVILDNGFRTLLPTDIPAHKKRVMNMLIILDKSLFNNNTSNTSVILSLVQEQCSWLYGENPKNGAVLSINALKNAPLINDYTLALPLTNENK